MIAPPGRPIDPTRWLSALPDDLRICDINIPGSHNAAAISKKRRTRWACQRHSISQQLEKGIRLLDIRLKPKKRREPRSPHGAAPQEYTFTTCHGHLGPFGANEFQSLESLLEECTNFLSAHPGETIILTIRIDDWRRTARQDHPQIIQALKATLRHLPLLRTPTMPRLRECRSRIYLINRINDDPDLGVPINIPDNTAGITLPPTAQRHYAVYVQDQYKKLNRRNPEAHKLRLTIEAFEKKPKGTLLLNFGSGTKPFGRFVYIMNDLAHYLTNQPPHSDLSLGRPQPKGWFLLDYPFGTHASSQPTSQPTHRQATDLPIKIIASNYH